jgi:antitoxin component of MazEF toxin-antitoxin module
LKSAIPELAKNLKSTDDKAIEVSLHAAAFIERRKRSEQAYELLSVSPKEKSEDAYFNRWTEIVGSLGDIAKSDLANHVAHRRVILDLVDDVIRTTEEGSYRREEVIHSIVFPKGKHRQERSGRSNKTCGSLMSGWPFMSTFIRT